VQFRLELVIRDVSLHPDGVNPVELFVRRQHDLRLTLTAGDEHATCVVESEFDPPAKVSEALKYLSEGRLPPKSLPREEWGRDHDYIDEAGRIQQRHLVPLYLMPQSFREFADALSDEMNLAAAHAVGVLRWRTRTLGLRQPFASSGMRWRFRDADDWQMLPRDIYVSIHGTSRLEVSEGAASELQDLLTRHALEPLAHELFREAWGQRQDNPRSSLLLGMAALEIGVKNYIGACVPDAEWLAENVPTPPLLRMLQEYLPALHPEGGTPIAPLDKDTADVLKVAVTLRNGLAHTGSDVPRERLAKTLRAIRNVLWRMDVARGHEWASDYVTSLEEDPSEGYRRI
jgi:hypothetical protein